MLEIIWQSIWLHLETADNTAGNMYMTQISSEVHNLKKDSYKKNWNENTQNYFLTLHAVSIKEVF